MERRETLHAVKQGKFPDQFGSCAGGLSGRVKECVKAMLADDELGGSTITELRQQIEAVLTLKATSVEGLFQPQSPLRRSST